MDKNSQKTLGNRDGRKLKPARYLNLREKICKLEPLEQQNFNIVANNSYNFLAVLHLEGHFQGVADSHKY